jgi:superfamily I DNA/RNA helicase
MASVTLMKGANKVDGSLKGKVLDFLYKLQEDDTAPGLHIEPMKTYKDSRARTGRVDQQFRAVLFKLNAGTEPHYVYAGTFNHDEAIKKAQTSILTVNPVSGIAELISAPAEGSATPPPAAAAPPAATGPANENGLQTAGYTPSYLLEELGIPERTGAAAISAASVEAFELVVTDEAVPEWQGLALIDLEAGKSLPEVKEGLGIGDYVDDPTKSEDEKLAEALKHPASKLEFTYAEGSEDLEYVINNESFQDWLVFLHPAQAQYAVKDRNGAFRLSGGAGTGKTVVAIHRAKHLADQDPDSRILLTTFTKTLADSLAQNLGRLDPGLKQSDKLGETPVTVAGIDSVAAQVWSKASPEEQTGAFSAVLGTPDAAATSRSNDKEWGEAIEQVEHKLEPALANPTFLSQEYLSIVLANSVTDRDGYLTVPRGGRGTPLNRTRRLEVWKVIEAYRRICRSKAAVSYPELAALAAAVLQHRAAGGGDRPFDHVIVDEAQDFHAGHWLLLRALVEPGANDLFIAEDSHQRIYGQKVPLSRFGIQIVGRSRRLTLNYRTTAQNLAFAVGLLSGIPFTDIEDTAEESADYRSARSGPHPQLEGKESLSKELDNAADWIKAWTTDPEFAPETIGVLVRSGKQVDFVVSGLLERGVSAQKVSGDKEAHPGEPVVMTMHRAKGMEFSKIILFGVGEGNMPLQWALKDLGDAEKSDALLQERSLLYVAATRARDELVVSWSGKPSELLGVSA